MEHAFNIRVSQRNADTALRRFIYREAGWGALLAAIFCVAYVAYDFKDGRMGFLSVVLLTLFTLLVLIYIAAFVTRKRQMADLLQKLGNNPVSYRLDESEIATQSPLGSSTLKWAMIRKLWVDPDLILVFYARNGYTTIPTSQIPADALDFLADQVRKVGGLILDYRTGQNKPLDTNT